ncbi:UNKNOWN [Stylonychia lemnae]|uniref:Uncharacterized protein n=1 Tax=Stylonychia lemnae TaxID=5949 RepID=A0A077ZQ99_STYLE|nr:UNKNOWN [Stylonychia lemnae]|eukprot:CDW71570.1 UNKNOWN [Stylonychia lemnae]
MAIYTTQPPRLENYSLQFNSQYSKSSRGGMSSNYMLNDHVLSQGDFDGDGLEGTQTFHQLNQFNNQELIELNGEDREKEDEQIPLSVKRGRQNTLTETEVREIVQQFNTCLNKLSLEKQDLENKTKSLVERIDDQQDIVIRLFKQKENVMMDNDNFITQVDQYQRQLKQLEEERVQTLNLQPQSTVNIDQDLVTKFDKTLQIENQIINKLKSNDTIPEKFIETISQQIFKRLTDLQQKKQTLLSSNDSMREQLYIDFEKSKLSQIKCQKCRLMFIPLNNNEDSCSFHPGKMKFYSCRGCGANQYFSCCNKCTLCCVGCKKSKHIA